jgi:hypothetical protein
VSEPVIVLAEPNTTGFGFAAICRPSGWRSVRNVRSPPLVTPLGLLATIR